MNIVCLSGNVCKDVELITTQNDKKIVANTIAVVRDRKDANGNYVSDFIEFVCYENNAVFLNNYGKKGDKVEIVGKIKNDSWKDKDDNYRNRTYIVVDTIKITTKRPKENKTEPFKITDDDLPF